MDYPKNFEVDERLQAYLQPTNFDWRSELLETQERLQADLHAAFEAFSARERLQDLWSTNFEVDKRLHADLWSTNFEVDKRLHADLWSTNFEVDKRLHADLWSTNFEVDKRLHADLWAASDWRSELFETRAASDQWTKVGRVKKQAKRTKFIIRKSRPIPIPDEDTDFVLRVSRPISIPAEIVVRVSRSIAIPEDASEIVDGR